MDTGLLLHVLWLHQRLLAHDRWSRPRLHAYQAAALARLRAAATARSPFYRRLHAGLADRPLAELPVVTKAMLMDHFDEVVTDRRVWQADVAAHLAHLRGDERFLGRYWVCATSGSTGRRGTFLFDRDEWATILAGFARAQTWAGGRVGLRQRLRLAAVASTAPWHMSSRLAASVQSPWRPTLRLDAALPLADIVASLNAFQPEALVLYPSMARRLAGEQVAGRLRIAPRVVQTGSEVLTAATRRSIEAAWGQPAFDQYGVTEGGLLAAECEQHSGLHVCEDLAILEIVDGDNRPVAPGAFGARLLITVLFSRTLPLIRYEVSDQLRLALAPCACGRPYALVDAIGGRAEEVLMLPGAAGGLAPVHPFVVHRLLDAAPVGAWQVVQEPARLRVLVDAPAAGFDAAATAAALQQALAEQGVARLPVDVMVVDALPRTASGKAVVVRPAG